MNKIGRPHRVYKFPQKYIDDLFAVGSLSDVARALHVTPTAVRKWVLAGMVGTQDDKGRWVLRKEDVIAWLIQTNKYTEA